MKSECRLCGGKLRNGICSECGMDNRKSDDMYSHMINRNECADKNLSHIHEDKNVKQYQDPVINKNKGTAAQKTQTAKKQKPYSQTPKYRPSGSFTSTRFTSSRAAGNRGVRRGTAITMLTAVILIVSVLGSVFAKYNSSVSVEEISQDLNKFQDYDYSEDYEGGYEEDYNPYAAIEEQLNPEGEHWEQEMPAGMYVVGVDIPEGEYTLTMREGNTCDVRDSAHHLSAYESFNPDIGESQSKGGIKLFRGAVLCVDGINPVGFVTENGQVQDMMYKYANPLTESVDISGKATAGIEFPAGTYDVSVSGEGFGVFQYEIPQNNLVENSYPLAFSVLMEENPTEDYPDYCSVYKNVVLPEGSTIAMDDFTIRLTPSQEIITEDYASFYNNFY